MGYKYSTIPIDTWQKLVMNAGIICKNFDPVTKVAENQIGATTGGLTVTCVPEFIDAGEDVDNCPKNMKGMKKVKSFEVKATGTLLSIDKNGVKMLLGAADISGNKITPRFNLTPEDFEDIWIVADYSDENTGENAGYIACHILNALNTSGFSLTTSDGGKGQMSFELTGHVAEEEQDKVPLEIYIGGGASEIPYVTLDKHVITIAEGAEETLNATVNPSDAEVTWSSSASGKADVSDGVVTGVDEGSAIITAAITENGVTYTDVCTVIVTAG